MIQILSIYILYLLLVSAFGIFIYSYFTDNDITGLTLRDLLDQDFQNKEGYIFQKTDDPDLPYALNPNTSKIHEDIEYNINRDGLRDNEYKVEKNGSRIIFLGDSFTWGHNLPLNYTFVKILEKQLQQEYQNDNWEVMNFGISGYNTKMEVLLLEKKGLKYSPDIVIVMYDLNDPEGPVEGVSFGEDGYQITKKIRSFFQGQLSNQERKQIEAFLEEQNCYYELMNLKAVTGSDDFYCMIHHIPLFWDTVTESFEKLENLSKKHNFTVIVGILPVLLFPGCEIGWQIYPFEDTHELVANEVKKHDFYVLDLYPVLSEYPIPKLRVEPNDCHTSYYANQIIESNIKDYLEEKNLT